MKKSQWNALWKQTIASATKEKTVAEDGITMQNYYDERDNIIASGFPVTKSYESQKIFQYSYDEHNRLTQMLTLDMGKESFMIQYHYSENKLCKSLHYDNRCTDSKLRLKTIHLDMVLAHRISFFYSVGKYHNDFLSISLSSFVNKNYCNYQQT